MPGSGVAGVPGARCHQSELCDCSMAVVTGGVAFAGIAMSTVRVPASTMAIPVGV